MELVVVLVILGGLWAALLLPSFLDSRNDAPIASTRDFDRNIARLASLSTANVHPAALARRRIRTRRRRVLAALIATAAVMLGAALWLGSIQLLVASLVVDGMLVAYLAVLIQIRNRDGEALVVDLDTGPNPEDDRYRAISSQ